MEEIKETPGIIGYADAAFNAENALVIQIQDLTDCGLEEDSLLNTRENQAAQKRQESSFEKALLIVAGSPEKVPALRRKVYKQLAKSLENHPKDLPSVWSRDYN